MYVHMSQHITFLQEIKYTYALVNEFLPNKCKNNSALCMYIYPLYVLAYIHTYIPTCLLNFLQNNCIHMLLHPCTFIHSCIYARAQRSLLASVYFCLSPVDIPNIVLTKTQYFDRRKSNSKRNAMAALPPHILKCSRTQQKHIPHMRMSPKAKI